MFCIWNLHRVNETGSSSSIRLSFRGSSAPMLKCGSGCAEKIVALTLDDGPHAHITPRVCMYVCMYESIDLLPLVSDCDSFCDCTGLWHADTRHSEREWLQGDVVHYRQAHGALSWHCGAHSCRRLVCLSVYPSSPLSEVSLSVLRWRDFRLLTRMVWPDASAGHEVANHTMIDVASWTLSKVLLASNFWMCGDVHVRTKPSQLLLLLIIERP